jgi:predicted transcriptional regulator
MVKSDIFKSRNHTTFNNPSLVGDGMEIKTWIIGKVDLNELTWDEFLSLIFPKQPKTRECADKILRYLKRKPATINEIIENEKLVRGTAYDAFNIMRRFGLISRKNKYSPLVLSEQFSNALERLSRYWKTWIKECSTEDKNKP